MVDRTSLRDLRQSLCPEGLLVASAAILIIIACFLPWATFLEDSTSGMDMRGPTVLAMSLLLLAFCVSRFLGLVGIALFFIFTSVLSICVAIIAAHDIQSIEDLTPVTQGMDVEVGVGLWLVFVASLASIVLLILSTFISLGVAGLEAGHRK